MAFWRKNKSPHAAEEQHIDELKRRTNALFQLLGELYGRDKLVLKAGKLDALDLMQGELSEEVLALERIVFEDPTIERRPGIEDISKILDDVEESIADHLARRDMEDRLEQKIAEKMQERHEEYVNELKMQVLREHGGPDNAQTLKKFAELEKLEERKLAHSILKSMRPRTVEEVVGQETACKALFSKIASPFPQHVLLYGPPGVGKTTVARLALEYARQLPFTPFADEAQFVEVDGTTLRWDPREVTNPLLGSVHDPIYQGARRDLAESSIPEPKPGLVTEAHGGVLFIDEIGEMDPILQTKLLKVLEDKRVQFDSSYYDPSDENIPKYIRKLFEEGAPADFVLIGATTRDPGEINPALRSRCAEVFFDPLGPIEIRHIVDHASQRLDTVLDDGVAALISDYTHEGRRATSLLADAYGLALHDLYPVLPEGKEAADGAADGPAVEQANKRGHPNNVRIRKEHLREVIRMARLSPTVTAKGSSSMEVGHVFGLGVYGYMGSIIEIEAIAFRAHDAGKGKLRFNQSAGSMAQDAVFNAASVVRKVTGQPIQDWDIHVNVVGGGRIDGPSAGAAVVLAIISALQERPLRQDVAITGEISIQGRIKPVGGVYEKLYGARQAGISLVMVPEKNMTELPRQVPGIDAVSVASIEDAMAVAFAEDLAPWLSTKQSRRAATKAYAAENPVPYRRPISGSG